MTTSTAEGQSQAAGPPIQALRQRLHQLMDTVHTMQRRCDELSRHEAAARSQQQALSEQLNALMLERNQLRAERDALVASQQELSSERNGLHQQRDALQTERDDLQAERDTLQAECDALSARLQTLTGQHQELTSEHQELSRQLERLSAQRDGLQEERDQLRAERDALAASQQELSSQCDGLQVERKAFQEQRDALQAERDSLQRQCDALQVECDTLTAKCTKGTDIWAKSIISHSLREIPEMLLSPEEMGEKIRLPAKTKLHRQRVFIKTMGSRENLERNELHRFAISHASCHYQSESIVTWIPKNACTNIRYSLAIANGAIRDERDFHWIHLNNMAFAPTGNREALDAKYTFIFLRNPYSRLASYFLDKLVGSSHASQDKSHDQAKEIFSLKPEEMTFENFIEILWKNPEKVSADSHIRPQVDFLLYDDYDDWFCIEDYEKAAKKILELTGIPLIDTRHFSLHTTSGLLQVSEPDMAKLNAIKIQELRKSGKIPCLQSLYNEELAHKVTTIYYSDIALYCKKIKSSSFLRPWLDKYFSSIGD